MFLACLSHPKYQSVLKMLASHLLMSWIGTAVIFFRACQLHWTCLDIFTAQIASSDVFTFNWTAISPFVPIKESRCFVWSKIIFTCIKVHYFKVLQKVFKKELGETYCTVAVSVFNVEAQRGQGLQYMRALGHITPDACLCSLYMEWWLYRYIIVYITLHWAALGTSRHDKAQTLFF